MTVVAAVMARSYAVNMFDDLTDVPHEYSRDKATGVTTLTFSDDLDEYTALAIRDRMTSRNDDDQAKRAHLCDQRDEIADTPDPVTLEEALALIALLKSTVADSLDYWLGEG